MGLAAPWLAHRDLKAAVQAQSDRPVAALAAIESARRWNRWDPESLEIRGAILERQGQPAAAARDFARAAGLSRLSWIDRFREARAAGESGDKALSRRACALAHEANPAEQHLYEALC